MSTLKTWLEAGRRLAERIPYSLVALVARLAVAGVFWRSGQTKVEGFLHIKDNTFFFFAEEYKVPLLPPDAAAYLTTFAEHIFSVWPRRRPGVASIGARPDAYDARDPDLRLPQWLARSHPVVRGPVADRGARTGRNLARPPHLVSRGHRARTRALGTGATSRATRRGIAA